MMDGVQTAVVSTCIPCKTEMWRHMVCVCVRARPLLCVHVSVCVVWHIFTEECVLSLSFGVRPEAMSNWSLHTFRLDSHWHARPWLSSLCHEKGKQWQRNMPPSWLRGKKLCCYFSPPPSSLWSRSLHEPFTVFSPSEEMNFSTMAAQS